MRRFLPLLFLLLIASLAIAACSSDDNDDDAPAVGSAPQEEAAASSAAASGDAGADADDSDAGADAGAGDDDAEGPASASNDAGDGDTGNAESGEGAGESGSSAAGGGTDGATDGGVQIINDCLNGTWRLNNDTFAFNFELASVANGDEFNVAIGTIGGEYVAIIENTNLRVEWREFNIPGQFTTSNGNFPMDITVDGFQEYTLSGISLETLTAALEIDATSITGTVAGISIPSGQGSIPPLTTDGFTCEGDELTVSNQFGIYIFARQ